VSPKNVLLSEINGISEAKNETELLSSIAPYSATNKNKKSVVKRNEAMKKSPSVVLVPSSNHEPIIKSIENQKRDEEKPKSGAN